jgi:4-diphosphocytidyl-2-C-methyl-D-erythritol kinase
MGDATCGVFARAKLNLRLAVLAREARGFHQIETIFCALELADEVDVSLAGDDVVLHVLPPPEEPGAVPDLGPAGDNLAYRAALMFCEAARVPARARITLTKRIPAGAGLGGGSSDAAAVLNALNTLHGEPLTRQQLLALGARLGSDVPFFVTGANLALAWGRGGRMALLAPLPARPVLLAVPQIRVATAAAYEDIARTRAHDPVPTPLLLPALDSWADVAQIAHNDFESVIFAQQPQLAALRNAIEDAGARIARMTGTGSVLFGVFDDAAPAERARDELAARFDAVQWLLTST